VATKLSYIVQEATVVIRNIFRKYPNQYESIIGTLCENLDSLDEPEAKAAMIWVIGQYADRIENSDELLEDFLDSFADEPHEVQLALLTATVKLFIQRPTKGQDLVPKVLKWATEETDHPDLRDRGYMYWRLLSSDPATAKQIVMGEKPPITAESERLDPSTLEEMCLVVGTLATVYLKPVQSVFRAARPRRFAQSPALQKHLLPTHVAAAEAQRQRQKQEAQAQLSSAPLQTTTSLPPTGQAMAAAAASVGMTSPSGNGAIRGMVPAGVSDSISAADAADLYFAGLGAQGMAQMQIADASPGGVGSLQGGEGSYVVNQHTQQTLTNGDRNGDLLLL
jgi:AP-2 complex subunit beta-1